MRYIRHRPGYTPEGAATRRFWRELARACGISPRRAKKMLRRFGGQPRWSAAREAMLAMMPAPNGERRWSYFAQSGGQVARLFVDPLRP